MKLIVGLGNPGRKYEGTRHNVGFEVIAELAKRYCVDRPKSKFNAEIVETIVKNEKTMLMRPLAFMNLSGNSVKEAFDFYKLSLDDILVICDDLNLPVGRLRLRPGGSAGGQNGLRNIIDRLGNQKVKRLRIGVDRPPPNWDPANYVLGRFTEEQQPAVSKAIKLAADAVETWISHGMDKAMSQFNPDPEKLKERAKRKAEADKLRAEALKKKQIQETEKESGDSAVDSSES